ncbi:MAG: DUF3747 domain-containing protein [Cyanobium sp.]
MALFPLQRAALVVSGAFAALGAIAAGPAVAGSLFQTAELNQQNFVLVTAPIGDGTKAQLNIYEQLNNRRPCFATQGSQPAQVNPLLTTFDFTGICGRFLDTNGYSVRVGGTDLAPTYRLTVIRRPDDNVLLAVPTTPGAGPEMVVARTQGAGDGFLQLVLEPGWELKRRAYNGRNLGHVYLYRADWPGGGEAVASPALPSPPELPVNSLPVQPFGSGS